MINNSALPLVTVQVACHSGDVHLLPRALLSVERQDLDHREVEVQIVFDGTPTSSELDTIDEAFKRLLAAGFRDDLVQLWSSKDKIGYYCWPRNRGVLLARGFYLAHLDADNEHKPNHLSGLLSAIRTPHPEDGWPHFVYSRREYVVDEGFEGEPPCEGPSPLVEWAPNFHRLSYGPKTNFVDTGDLLVGRSLFYRLAEATGKMWDPECRRFGDWELIQRMAQAGMRGRAVDQVSSVYHWTGSNLQLKRSLSDYHIIPESAYKKLKAEGLIKDD